MNTCISKNEARQCVMDNYHIVTQGCDLGLCGRDKDADAFEEAIDILLDAPSIAQSIRDAAISGNLDNMSGVEFDICTAFSNDDDWIHWSSPCYFQKDSGLQHHACTFLLFVAEALE